jgi:hypothetical protein
MRPIPTIHIPQPCHESWDAMTTAPAGRHCAACAKTVVDFTLKTDAEILAYLAGAAGGRTCGRFAAGQLERPLQRAAPVASAARWRAWLAALVAVWAVREGVGSEARAQAATEWRARYWGGPAPAAPNTVAPIPAGVKPLDVVALPSIASSANISSGMVSSQSGVSAVAPPAAEPLVLRGMVTDFSTKQGLPGATVLLKGTNVFTSTTVDGFYELPVPVEMANAPALTISLSFVGFMTQERTLATRIAGAAQAFQLQADVKGRLMGEVVVVHRKLPPAPWHPRAFYYWGKYWLTRPFSRG